MKVTVLLSAISTIVAASCLFAATLVDNDSDEKTLTLLSAVFWFIAGLLIVYFLVFKDKKIKPECEVN